MFATSNKLREIALLNELLQPPLSLRLPATAADLRSAGSLLGSTPAAQDRAGPAEKSEVDAGNQRIDAHFDQAMDAVGPISVFRKSPSSHANGLARSNLTGGISKEGVCSVPLRTAPSIPTTTCLPSNGGDAR